MHAIFSPSKLKPYRSDPSNEKRIGTIRGVPLRTNASRPTLNCPTASRHSAWVILRISISCAPNIFDNRPMCGDDREPGSRIVDSRAHADHGNASEQSCACLYDSAQISHAHFPGLDPVSKYHASSSSPVSWPLLSELGSRHSPCARTLSPGPLKPSSRRPTWAQCRPLQPQRPRSRHRPGRSGLGARGRRLGRLARCGHPISQFLAFADIHR